MTVRSALAGVALLVVLGVGGVVFVRALDNPNFLAPDDYVEYWAAGHLNMHGQDPYSAELLLPLERYAGRDTDEAVMMWNPPWTLTLAMPLGALHPRAGQVLWLVLNFLSITAASLMFWKMFGGRTGMKWLAVVVGLTFMPSVEVLGSGQISGLILLGCALFLWCIKHGYQCTAGAAACLIAVKPHLASLFWLVVGLEAVFNRRWRVVAGGLGTGLIATAIPMLINPEVWTQYYVASRTSPVPLSNWMCPTIGVSLRLVFGLEHFWLQFLPMGVGVFWGMWYWYDRRRVWDWVRYGPLVFLVALVVTPYGAWHFDLVILVLPVLERMALLLGAAGGGKVQWRQLIVLITLLCVVNGGMLVVHILRLGSYPNVWVAPATLLIYLITETRRTTPRVHLTRTS